MRDDDVATVLRLWIEKAENDLKNAAHTLKMGDDAPTDTICLAPAASPDAPALVSISYDA